MSQTVISDPTPVGFVNADLGDGPLLEVVDGQEVAKPVMGVFEGSIASILTRRMGNQAEEGDCGRVVSEVMFRIFEDSSRMRRPDVAFVSYQRWGRDQKLTSGNGWDVIPDLVVEVVSPTDFAVEVMAKVREYLSAGVVRVWVIYPRLREVHIFDGATGVRVVGPDQTLDGDDLLPGFRLPLADLFRDGSVD